MSTIFYERSSLFAKLSFVFFRKNGSPLVPILEVSYIYIGLMDATKSVEKDEKPQSYWITAFAAVSSTLLYDEYLPFKEVRQILFVSFQHFTK